MSTDKDGDGTAGGSAGRNAGGYNLEMLRRCDDKFTRFSECSWDGIMLTTESGVVVEWNPAMEEITGISRSEVIGKYLWDANFSLVPEKKRTSDLPEHLKKLVLLILKTGRIDGHERIQEYQIQRPDNQTRFVESFMFTIPAGDTFQLAGIIRDITSRKRSEIAVQEANQKLNLLSSITRHDINNQLTIFNGYLTLLEIGTPAMKREDIIKILHGATDKILRILKFTKIYQDLGVTSPSWQDVGETIRLARTMVEALDVTFPLEETCSGIEVYADPMLVRVFSNLIDNSIRHGEKVTEIRIRCNVEEHRLVIVYEDNGIGISDKIRPVLFERGKGKNTGYGMFLIREILTITGFTIAETGTSGNGVRFEIVVPEGAFRISPGKDKT